MKRLADFLAIFAAFFCLINSVRASIDSANSQTTKSLEILIKLNMSKRFKSVEQTQKTFTSTEAFSDSYSTIEKATTESTTKTTQVTAAEKTDPPVSGKGFKCALWTRYMNDSQPTLNGFSAGVSLDGTQAYVARGIGAFMYLPGRAKMLDDDRGLVFVSWLSERNASDAEYLVLSAGCLCSFIPIAVGKSASGLVVVSNGLNRFLIGRKIFANGRVSISRVMPPAFVQSYPDGENGRESTDMAKSVLVCENNAASVVTPTVRGLKKFCGMWTSLEQFDQPSMSGLAIGRSPKNSIVYVGRAFHQGYQYPGRVQVESPAGVYLASGTEIMGSEPELLQVPKGCACAFKNIEELSTGIDGMLIVTGFVQTTNDYFVGRKNLSDDTVTVSRVDFKKRLQVYVDERGFERSASITEVLRCEMA